MSSQTPECDAKATAFVGGDWRGARLTVQVAPPSPGGWQGGSRWFRCDILSSTWPTVAPRSGIRTTTRCSTPAACGTR
ncbi:septum formation family protein [Micromonospora sp. AKA38]|uniref:septum formation family protein n=1 Tax=Micromonospora sp. AKA38 TaxID=2733861 RepID=UPI0035B52872